MASDRLTRQELSWLLAQEARSAADLLRKGVSGLTLTTSPQIGEMSSSLDSTLDVLDDTMRTLTSLHAGPPASSRRGRIDVAALLFELAPSASINLEPGSGTEVFADEAELRRMFQVLVSLGGATGATGPGMAPLTVRRQGDDIRIAVSLGPDSSGAARMEQAWLHRMAVKFGGSLHLEGGELALALPAGADQERREVHELRRELAAAQEQGEAYARELASMFSKSDSAAPPTLHTPVVADPSHALTNLCRAVGERLQPELHSIGKTLLSAGEEGAAKRLQALQVLTEELLHFAHVAPAEASVPRDLSLVARSALADLGARAERRGVEVKLDAAGLVAAVRPSAAEALLYLLLSQAIEASPRESLVHLSLAVDGGAIRLQVDDAGPAIPASVRDALVSLDTDSAAVGRPEATGLFLAATLARRWGAALSLSDAPSGGARVVVLLPAS
jgi:signal transduction histidine kinase